MAAVYAEKNRRLKDWQRKALQRAINAVEAAAQEVPGYPAALKPVAVAQFLLESSWGRAGMEAHNYFGIKARDGEPFVERRTSEVVNGKRIEVVAKFRRFASMAECFVEHAKLIVNRRWKGTGKPVYGLALGYPDDPVKFALALTGVYATDPQYGQKLHRVMLDRGLLETFGFSV